jgi:iron complex transport system ATP-binding protein
MFQLKIQNLSTQYHSLHWATHRTTSQQFLNLNLSLNSGKIIGIMGVNGSGKSSLLQQISQIASQTIRTDGKIEVIHNSLTVNMAQLSPQERASWVSYAGSELLSEFNLTAEEAILLSGYRFYSNERILELRELCKVFGINPDSHQTIDQYSGGEKQRILFLQSWYQDAKIKIFDETFSKLDLNYLVKIAKFLKQTRSPESLTIIVSHDLNYLKHLCDEVIWIHQYQPLWQGPALESLNAQRLKEIYSNQGLGSDSNGNPINIDELFKNQQVDWSFL